MRNEKAKRVAEFIGHMFESLRPIAPNSSTLPTSSLSERFDQIDVEGSLVTLESGDGTRYIVTVHEVETGPLSTAPLPALDEPDDDGDSVESISADPAEFDGGFSVGSYFYDAQRKDD